MNFRIEWGVCLPLESNSKKNPLFFGSFPYLDHVDHHNHHNHDNDDNHDDDDDDDDDG